MARMNLVAAPPPMPFPDSYGDNTIVNSMVFSLMSEPQNFQDMNKYEITIMDFLDDTFPQFSHSTGLDAIVITDLKIPSSMWLNYAHDESPVRVGDVLEIINGKLRNNLYLHTNLHFIDMEAGFIKYGYDLRGIGINPKAISEITLLRFSTSDNFQFEFLEDVTINYLRTVKKYTFKRTDFTKLFEYTDILDPSWTVDPALRLRTLQYFNQYGGAPYKIQLEEDLQQRLRLYGKPIKIGQKIPLGAIGMGYLTIDLEDIDEYTFTFRFGNAYIGSFRLTPYRTH